jgi:hypothetical protein
MRSICALSSLGPTGDGGDDDDDDGGGGGDAGTYRDGRN